MAEPQLSTPDRRQHERRTLRGAAQLSLNGQAAIAVRMLHLSSGGMGIVVSSNLPGRTAGVIRFNIPGKVKGSDSFEVQITVTHSVYASAEDGFKVGLQFSDIPASLATAIGQYLAK